MSENIKLECLKLAFSAAIQYGAFKPENLGARGHTHDGRPNHNWSTHFGAILGMADALFEHVSKKDDFISEVKAE